MTKPVKFDFNAASKLPQALLRRKTDEIESHPTAPERLPHPVAYLRRSRKRDNDSIERQIQRANDYCERVFGMPVKEFYIDKGKSGEVRTRIQFKRLKEDVKSGLITALIVEEIDRIGRTMAIIAGECENFKNAGVVVHSVTKGAPIDNLDIAFKGFMATEHQTLLRERTRSGVHNAISAGKVISICFGYKAVPGRTGEREIDENARPIVEWMFKARLDGMSYNEMARILSSHTPKLKGDTFTAAGIRHMLANSIYAGVFVYGRKKYSRNPQTDRTETKPVPPSEWRVTEVPHLQIIPLDIWEAVYATLAHRPLRHFGRTLLSCKVIIEDESVPTCYDHGLRKFKRANASTFRGSKPVESPWLSTFVLESLRCLLEDDALEAHFQEQLTAAFGEATREVGKKRSELKAHLTSVERHLDSAFDEQLTNAFPKEFLDKRIAQLSAEYATARDQLVALPAHPKAPTLDSSRRLKLLEAFDGFVARLSAQDFMVDNLDPADLQIAHAIRGMVENVVCQRIQGSASMKCTVTFSLDKVFGVLRSSLPPGSTTRAFERIRHFTSQAIDNLGFAQAWAERRHFATDEQYDAILQEHGAIIMQEFKPDEMPLLRQAIDRQLFLQTLSRYWISFRFIDRSPERKPAMALARRLDRTGLWQAILLTFETKFPDRHRTINVSYSALRHYKGL